MAKELLPLKAMPDYLSLLNAQSKINDDQSDINNAVLMQFQYQLYAFFKTTTNPPSRWIAELLALATFYMDKGPACLEEIHGIYLDNIAQTTLLSPITLKGFADLLKIGSQAKWLNSTRLTEIFGLLKKKSLLFRTDLPIEELLQIVSVWQELLLALETCHVDIVGYKQEIENTLSGIKARFKKEKELVGYWQVKLAEQALYRISDSREGPSPWFAAAVCLGSASVHLCEAGGAIASGTATFGVSALAAVGPLIS